MNEEIVSKGVTEDYIWHEAKSIRTKLKSVQSELEEFVMVVAARDKDNKQVIAKLYAENFQMNQEIKDLKEKNDGRTT
jgi:16S rRNA C1402 (ribose-2'-O) methylase RsmI